MPLQPEALRAATLTSRLKRAWRALIVEDIVDTHMRGYGQGRELDGPRGLHGLAVAQLELAMEKVHDKEFTDAREVLTELGAVVVRMIEHVQDAEQRAQTEALLGGNKA